MGNNNAGFRTTGQALQAMNSAMKYLAAADAAALTSDEKADALLGLEHLDAIEVSPRAGLLAAFDAAGEYELDGYGSLGAWQLHKARVTKGEAAGYKAWIRRAAEHPVLVRAMLDGYLSRSWAVKVMALTGKLPQPHRGQADEIIAAAAKAGVPLAQLLHLAAEILARVAPPDDDGTGGKEIHDRYVRVETTLDGAGVLTGQLTPECAAAVQAVLGELARRQDKDDHRLHGERMHDALEEAMARLLGSDMAPRRAGHPVTALVHIGLADVLATDDGSVLMAEWAADLAARWAGHRAGASEQPGDGGAWITGPAARGYACDAMIAPVVTGNVDLAHLYDLVRLCVELDQHWHRDPGGTEAGYGAGPVPDRGAHQQRMRELMEQIIGRCAAVLAGPDGLASHLRTSLLAGAGLGGRSMVLDVGDTDAIPAWMRRTVMMRDQSCRWPGGCSEPADQCQPHHLMHRSEHGHTSLGNLYLFCFVHHHVFIHRRGWTLTARPDGTLEARSPDGTTVYREPARPPPRPG